MITRETAMSKERAIAQAHRYTQSPRYTLPYLLGKHLTQKLRDEVTKKDGRQV